MGMGTVCTGKKAPKYGHGDILHWQKGPPIWAWGNFAMAKRPPYMGMGESYFCRNGSSVVTLYSLPMTVSQSLNLCIALLYHELHEKRGSSADCCGLVMGRPDCGGAGCTRQVLGFPGGASWACGTSSN